MIFFGNHIDGKRRFTCVVIVHFLFIVKEEFVAMTQIFVSLVIRVR